MHTKLKNIAAAIAGCTAAVTASRLRDGAAHPPHSPEPAPETRAAT